MASLILILIGSGNGLSPVWHQAIPWTNDDLLSIQLVETNFNENLIKIQLYLLEKIHMKMSAISSHSVQPQCVNTLGLEQNDHHFADDMFKVSYIFEFLPTVSHKWLECLELFLCEVRLVVLQQLLGLEDEGHNWLLVSYCVIVQLLK